MGETHAIRQLYYLGVGESEEMPHTEIFKIFLVVVDP